MQHIIDLEHELKAHPHDLNLLAYAKRYGFSDKMPTVGRLQRQQFISYVRSGHRACLQDGGYLTKAEFESLTPYFYSSYEAENESIVTNKPKIVVLGSGPIVGQGWNLITQLSMPFLAIKAAGYESHYYQQQPRNRQADIYHF